MLCPESWLWRGGVLFWRRHPEAACPPPSPELRRHVAALHGWGLPQRLEGAGRAAAGRRLGALHRVYGSPDLPAPWQGTGARSGRTEPHHGPTEALLGSAAAAAVPLLLFSYKNPKRIFLSASLTNHEQLGSSGIFRNRSDRLYRPETGSTGLTRGGDSRTWGHPGLRTSPK